MNTAQATALTTLATIQDEGIAMVLSHNTKDEAEELAVCIHEMHQLLRDWLPSHEHVLSPAQEEAAA